MKILEEVWVGQASAGTNQHELTTSAQKGGQEEVWVGQTSAGTNQHELTASAQKGGQ
jgi:hypothetical protein